MKIQKKYKIELVTSTDETRYPLAYVHIDEKTNSLVATNGRMLAKVPVIIEENDEIGTASISKLVLADARSAAPKHDSDFTLGLRKVFEICDGRTYPRPIESEVGTYPNYMQIIPKSPKIHHEVTLNPQMLLALAKALGDDKSITLKFEKNPLNAIIAENGEAYGLLMPMKK